MYQIEVLMREGFSRREIRRYIERRVLPPAIGRGPAAYYTEGHLLILRRIRQSREARRTLMDLAEEVHRAHPSLFRHPYRSGRNDPHGRDDDGSPPCPPSGRPGNSLYTTTER